MKKPRRRLSSDGFHLFNMAYTPAMPRRSIVKKMLHCMFHTEYDDKLDLFVSQLRDSSKQLYMFSNHKDLDLVKLIDNSIMNVIYSCMLRDGSVATKHQIMQNIRYYSDAMQRCFDENDHNSALMLHSALKHHSIKQLKIRDRKKDTEFKQDMEIKYGTWQNCYKHHLLEVMSGFPIEVDTPYIPSMMVLKMHENRHRAFSTIGKCKIKYEPYEIRSKIGLLAVINPLLPVEQFPLYNYPEVSSSTDLIMITSKIKK